MLGSSPRPHPRAGPSDPHVSEAQSAFGRVKHCCIRECFLPAQDCARHFEKLQRHSGLLAALKEHTGSSEGVSHRRSRPRPKSVRFGGSFPEGGTTLLSACSASQGESQHVGMEKSFARLQKDLGELEKITFTNFLQALNLFFF